jgi:threonine aldolase
MGIAGIGGTTILEEVSSNIVFCRLPSDVTNGLLDEGFQFYHDRWAPEVVRFVTSFASREAEVDHLVGRLAALTSAQPEKL